MKSNEQFANTTMDVIVKIDKPEQMDDTKALLAAAGVDAKNASPELHITGNLGMLMSKILQDADDMYKNNGTAVAARYGWKKRRSWSRGMSCSRVWTKRSRNRARSRTRRSSRM